jgi:hypothetical protein
MEGTLKVLFIEQQEGICDDDNRDRHHHHTFNAA